MGSQEFWSGWWWPAATALLGFVFAGLVFSQWLKRRKPHQLAWSVGLLMYAVAAVMEAASEGLGYWNPFVYRIYIVLAASLVGFLGLGTYYLMARKKERPTYFLVYLLVAFTVFLIGALVADLDESKLVPGITVGGQALGPSMSFPRVMSFFFNIPGTLLLLGGAVISAYRFSLGSASINSESHPSSLSGLVLDRLFPSNAPNSTQYLLVVPILSNMCLIIPSSPACEWIFLAWAATSSYHSDIWIVLLGCRRSNDRTPF